ncbi:hypothetical protein A1O3_08669 [Capronia epimyces CBS 606.96]|uniref:Transcription factor domain-containing protein n=1 Tax=Capronia epimyces CBS 606.96 TaxID=1182542 RepID=W9XG02_9EURO|nr:uncharacterized protein A1O3_08669 [Capronia epimyces CBS 606.96]EXJ79168.1 hypothetical protein A1O3_08669 [Capronia epimyces CBS 606.96]
MKYGHRAALSLTIHDAELSCLSHHESSIRSGSNCLHLAAQSEVYSATDAQGWLQELQKHKPVRTTYRDLQQRLQRQELLVMPGMSSYSLYIALVEISSAACDERATGTLYGPAAFGRFSSLLTCWYQSYKQIATAGEGDRFCLMIYWHAIFIYISVDIGKLEHAVGRDAAISGDPDSNLTSVEYAREWSTTKAAERAVAHAFLIQKQLGARRLDQEPAIHVPRAVFQAALVLYCYTQFWSGLDATNATSKEGDTASGGLDFPEIELLGYNPSAILFELHGFRPHRGAPYATAVLCAMYDLLQRVGHWDIAREFSRTLGSLLSASRGLHLHSERTDSIL